MFFNERLHHVVSVHTFNFSDRFYFLNELLLNVNRVRVQPDRCFYLSYPALFTGLSSVCPALLSTRIAYSRASRGWFTART